MKEKPCHCDRENENCPYCFGRGYLPAEQSLSTDGLNFVPANKKASENILKEMQLIGA